MQLSYIGSRTHKLFMMWFNNRAVPVPGIPQTTATVTERRPDPRYFELRQVRNASNAYFDAARVDFKAPTWHGLMVDASYWFSKALDSGSNYTNMAAGDEARQGYSQSQDPVEQDLKAVSAFDQSHAATVRFQYAIPNASNRFLRRVAGGWRISGVFLAKTGFALHGYFRFRWTRLRKRRRQQWRSPEFARCRDSRSNHRQSRHVAAIAATLGFRSHSADRRPRQSGIQHLSPRRHSQHECVARPFLAAAFRNEYDVPRRLD